LFLCFLALFSLDVIAPGLSPWQIAVGLIMHNIPVFVLAVVLAVSWKRELVGGVSFTLIGALFFARAAMTMLAGQFGWAGLLGSLPLAAPALLIGTMFIIGWLKKRDVRRSEPGK
jgi:hypothetical protein